MRPQHAKRKAAEMGDGFVVFATFFFGGGGIPLWDGYRKQTGIPSEVVLNFEKHPHGFEL